MYSPYDWQENLQHRDEMVRNSLRQGSPVVAVSFDAGLMMLTIRAKQRKVFEIYDRLMYSAIGRHSDVESVRVAALDFAHQEGYQRSEDDVTVQRVVGFALSPALKKAYGDPNALPVMIRALFAEMGDFPERDLLYALDYSGDFNVLPPYAGIAGDQVAEDAMNERLAMKLGATPNLDMAVMAGLSAWAIGRERSIKREDEPVEDAQAQRRLVEELETGTVEIGILERAVRRENRFRLLDELEVEPYINRVRG